MMHSSFYWNQPSRPIPLATAQRNRPAHARRPVAAASRSSPRVNRPARASVLGRGLLAPGVLALACACASARGRGSRQPGPGPPFHSPAWAKRSPSSFPPFSFPRRLLLPSPGASERERAATGGTERAAPRRAPSPARASIAR
jgi:hypothetical protein